MLYIYLEKIQQKKKSLLFGEVDIRKESWGALAVFLVVKKYLTKVILGRKELFGIVVGWSPEKTDLT